MFGEGVVQIEFSGDSSAERVVDEFQPRRAVLGADEPVFGVICVGRGVELGHIAVIIVQRTDATSSGNIDFGVLVQAVRVVGLRGGVLVGTGTIPDVVEDVAHVVLRHVGSVFADGAGDFGPLVVGVVPGCIVLERRGRPATKGVVDVSGLIGRVGVDEGKTVVCVVGVGDGEEGGACALLPSLHQGQIGFVEVGIGDGGGVVFDRGVTSCGGIVGVDGRSRTFEENGLRATNGVVSPGNRGAGVRGKRELFGGHFAVGVVSRGLGACAVAAADFATEGVACEADVRSRVVIGDGSKLAEHVVGVGRDEVGSVGGGASPDPLREETVGVVFIPDGTAVRIAFFLEELRTAVVVIIRPVVGIGVAMEAMRGEFARVIVIFVFDGIGRIAGLGKFLTSLVVGVGHGSAERVDDSRHAAHVVVTIGRDGAGGFDDGGDLTVGIVDLTGDIAARIGLGDLPVEAVVGEGRGSAEDGDGREEKPVTLNSRLQIGNAGVGTDDGVRLRGRVVGFRGGRRVAASINGDLFRPDAVIERVETCDLRGHNRCGGRAGSRVGCESRGHGDLIDRACGGDEIGVGERGSDGSSA